ncbi:MAG: hypothetical protein JOZ47_16340 [Kutzneria sp.]|nr:hypothetical protein [Kutzneria sp.]MBV9846617.1 hypothetical protein [Kutzneria sp.]
MESYQGLATLEWWANRSTCLGRFDIRATGSDWTCHAKLDVPPPENNREVFDFLMELDPVFVLRFYEESTLLVNVVRTAESGRLALTAYEPAGLAGSEQVPR